MNFKDFKEKFEKSPVEENNNRVDSAPKVSVCIQTYQHKKYIKECIDGILNQQTTFLYEILLGDDESTDGTREICIEYAEKYPKKIRLFLHQRENNIKIDGQATGRFNFMYNIYSARGKYIALCEGDDYWTDPLKLQKQVEFLEKNNDFSTVFHNVMVKNNRNGKNSSYFLLSEMEKDIFLTKDLLEPCFIHTASVLFRNSKNLEFPSWMTSVASGDIALFLLLSLEGKLKYFKEIMSVYRKHDGGVSITHTGYSKVFSMIYLYKAFDAYTNSRFESELDEAIKLEIQGHLPEIHELRRLRRNKKIQATEIIRKVVARVKRALV